MSVDYKVFESSEGNVSKYVFTGKDYVAESVLYKYGSYNKRTVICCSTQSGCPVGCKFCGTGNQFIRDLTSSEILNQIQTVLKDKGIENINSSSERFQIMFMSMGEPMLNWDNVESAIFMLKHRYCNAELLLSTIAPREPEAFNRLLRISKPITSIGLQFSIHKSNNIDRNKLIPYENKYTLEEIRDYGLLWWKETGRRPYLNYCIDGTNNTEEDFKALTTLFSPVAFNFTFSVVCSKNENMKEAGYKNLDDIEKFESMFMNTGYNTRIFNPDGQDDIGGGCGQLWYVQEWMKENKK